MFGKFSKIKSIFDILLIIYALAIFISSSSEQPLHVDLGFDWQDKLFHLLAFSLFALLAILSFYNHISPCKNWISLSALFCMLYAGSDEIHQYFVPGRYCDFFDFLADVCGILIVHSAGYFYVRWRLNARKS